MHIFPSPILVENMKNEEDGGAFFKAPYRPCTRGRRTSGYLSPPSLGCHLSNPGALPLPCVFVCSQDSVLRSLDNYSY